MTTSIEHLIPALDSRGPQPAIVSYGPDGRTELSGRVLANWLIKNVNFLRDELMLEPEALMVIDMPPHWKRTVFTLSGWLIGAHVHVCGPGAQYEGETPDVLVTDNPGSDLATTADDVVVLEAVSLALSYSGELGAMDIDWVQAVRSHSDALTSPIETVSGPSSAEAPTMDRIALESPDTSDASSAIGAWLAGTAVITPTSALSPDRRRSEGLDE